MQHLLRHARTIEKFAVDNSPLIFTAVGVAGAVTTALLTGKATFKAAHIFAEESPFLTNTERVKLVWPYYVAPVCSLGLTVASILMAHQVNTRRGAAMAAAYSLSERAFEQYKDKVVEHLGEKKNRQIKAEVAQENVAKNNGSREVIISSGEVLCYDEFSGRYFTSSVETIRQAMNDVNYQVLSQNYCALTDFYNKIGLDGNSMSEELGWNLDLMMEIDFSTVMSNDGRPCVSINFRKSPVRNYYRL